MTATSAVGIKASLVGRPPGLFLDEPATGLDPRSRNGLWAVIPELVAEGTTLLLTTQHMGEAGCGSTSTDLLCRPLATSSRGSHIRIRPSRRSP